MTGLITHLESHLGPITGGRVTDADGIRVPFQVVRFDGGPVPGTVTLMTLGLSEKPLLLAHSRIRQELIISVHARCMSPNLPGVLQQVGIEVISR